MAKQFHQLMSREDLECFANNGLTPAEVAERIGCSKGTVMRRAKRFGVAFGRGIPDSLPVMDDHELQSLARRKRLDALVENAVEATIARQIEADLVAFGRGLSDDELVTLISRLEEMGVE